MPIESQKTAMWSSVGRMSIKRGAALLEKSCVPFLIAAHVKTPPRLAVVIDVSEYHDPSPSAQATIEPNAIGCVPFSDYRSSLRIVPMPRGLLIIALLLGPLKSTKKVSLASRVLSR